MTRKTRLITMAVLTAAIALPLSAKNKPEEAKDSLLNDHHIVLVGSDSKGAPSQESRRKLIEQFYIDQFENSRDPQSPYFIFMSRDANFAMGVGGDVRMRGYFDPGNSMPGSDFVPVDIPMHRTDLNRNHLGTSLGGSALYFRVIGNHQKIGNYQVYIRAKFNGPNNEFKLNKAYAIVNDWTFGYAMSTFSDPDAEPPSVDSDFASLSMDYSRLLVRWAHSFTKSGMSVAASLEVPKLNIDETQYTKARSQSVPDVVAMTQYSWASGQHIRLSGVMRWLPYRDMLAGRNHSPMGWGMQLSTVLNPVSPLVLYGTFNIGRSYSNNSGDFLLGDYDLVGNPAVDGRLKTIPQWSYLVGASYYFTHKLYSTVAFGQARVTSRKLDNEYKYGLFGTANLIYKITPRVNVGAQFSLGKRADYDGDSAWARRLSLAAQFSF